MRIELATREGVAEYLLERFEDGWCRFAGSNEIIMQLEYSIYPPGTPSNADFEIIFIATGKLIIMGKKTIGLKEFLQNPTDFDELIYVEFHPDRHFKMMSLKPWDSNDIAIIAEEMAKDLFENAV